MSSRTTSLVLKKTPENTKSVSQISPYIPQFQPDAFLDVPETFADAPIALQLVGKHFRDEETVAATELVSRIVQS